jgi:hypothetical protein
MDLKVVRRCYSGEEVEKALLQHDDSLYFIACRNAMGFRCILDAEMKMPKYPQIAIFEGISY